MIEDYDIRLEQMRLQALDRRQHELNLEGLAEQVALAQHPVSKYVKQLPIDPPLYPAIEYLRFAEANSLPFEPDDLLFQERPEEHRSFITWCMPAHDQERPRQKGCGFIRSPGGLVFSMCPEDESHFIKGKRRHCWSLRCPDCMNDTALKRGVAVERQLLTYKALMKKKGIDVGEIGHWVVSPPQELVKCLCQTKEEYDDLSVHIEDSMTVCGASAGVSFFHPWRQRETKWEFSPHFHILCYGRIDTGRFLDDHPGWIIKKVHPRERIRSIRHTVAYLTTHMGLGMAEKDPDEVDWDLAILNHFDPGILSRGAGFSEKDYDNLSQGRGRMVGDLSDVDWVEWTKSRLFTELRIRFWGGVARKNIRSIGVYRQYKVRVCQKCGALLRTYEGASDKVGTCVRYIQDNSVFAFAEDAVQVMAVYQSFKSKLREDGISLLEFSRLCPFAVCSLDIGLPDNGDLVMEGPFEEPDGYFIRRQKNAYGTEA